MITNMSWILIKNRFHKCDFFIWANTNWRERLSTVNHSDCLFSKRVKHISNIKKMIWTIWDKEVNRIELPPSERIPWSHYFMSLRVWGYQQSTYVLRQRHTPIGYCMHVISWTTYIFTCVCGWSRFWHNFPAKAWPVCSWYEPFPVTGEHRTFQE